ncbi:MAG: hypothetical protein IKS19_04575 [Clostridia bacterium]|nr:hypothetical protein [Clostridia bacterium]
MQKADMKKEEQDLLPYYVIISRTSTALAGIIRLFTGYGFNHASISLDEQPARIYSFARYNYHSPLAGGFIEESAERFDFKTKKPSLAKVYRLYATSDEIRKMRAILDRMSSNPDEYVYDSFGALGLRFLGNDHCFTCVGFVAHMMKASGYLPQEKAHYSIRRLDRMLENELFFSGFTKDFAGACQTADQAYFERKDTKEVFSDSFKRFARLFRFYRLYKTKRLKNGSAATESIYAIQDKSEE